MVPETEGMSHCKDSSTLLKKEAHYYDSISLPIVKPDDYRDRSSSAKGYWLEVTS